jgi:Zn-dependent M28 family amino/carboxypeptidase
MSRRPLLCCALLLTSGCATITPKFVLPPAEAEDPIDPVRIEADIRFLADDLLEGRAIGSPGLALAARYHENVFRSLGMEPAFKGGFRQPFELQGSLPDPSATLAVEGHALEPEPRHREDFIVVSHCKGCPQEVTGELVYGGYLIQAPGRGWDDVKGADLKDKVLLVEVNEPGNREGGAFDGKAMTYYGRWTYKFEKARELGARGVLIVHNEGRATYGWDVVRNSWSGEGFYVADPDPRPAFKGWVQEALARKLLKLAGKDHAKLVASAERRDFRPVPTGLTVRVRQRSTFRTVTVENVAGILRAKHPKRRDAYVVLSAHFDHLGKREAGDDRIYNGAVDNCAASAAMLAAARHFASRRGDLRTHLIFLGATAEEEGLHGSSYFARHLPVPREKVLANINFEMTNVWGETRDLYAIGGKQSTLDAVCRRAAEAIGARYTEERGLEDGFFFRSDQLSFARRGIPAVWLHEGETSLRGPAEHIRERREAYKQRHYHKPSDDVRVLEGEWDLRGTAQIARWAAAIVEQIGLAKERPRFMKESAFAGAR